MQCEVLAVSNPEIMCRVCGNTTGHTSFIAREMMFGTREEFEYFLCESCGCLQITDIPEDLARYYPRTYYSFTQPKERQGKISRIRLLLEKWRVHLALFGRGYTLAKIAANIVDMPPQLHSVGPWLKICQIRSFEAAFLDIGCGTSSWWLEDLKRLGFNNLLGIDPYIAHDVDDQGIRILRQDIEDTKGSFDLITLHHSLEHAPNQTSLLKAIKARLKPGGVCLVRIPVVSSRVWAEYSTDWVELDAPRHLYLHSLNSINYVAAEAGLRLVHNCCDSTEFEFWGSEQYRRDIPLMDERSFLKTPSKSDFTFRELAEFRQRAEDANREGQCGRGCFFFQAAS